MNALLDIGLETTKLKRVKDIKIPDIFNRRMKTGISRIDDLFDAGILPGGTFTITAQAGCGKTTLMLQMLEGLAKNGYKVGYCSGEESVFQLAFTCKRIGVQRVEIANITDIDEITKLTEEYDLLIIDSFQALTTKKKMNMRAKELYAVQSLVKTAKQSECSLGFIMHLTKDGKLKGSTVVPHTVDACLNISRIEDVDDGARSIYFTKNRFGPCNELETMLTARGYDFTAKVIRDDESASEKKLPSKSERKKKQVEEILKIIKKTGWTKIGDIAKVTDDDVSRAQFLLREQVTLGKLEKTGRGQSAYWRATK
jgi:predicted ATP-dependent serine protease